MCKIRDSRRVFRGTRLGYRLRLRRLVNDLRNLVGEVTGAAHVRSHVYADV